MNISLDIPSDQERALRDAWGEDLDRVALEAIAIEGYRSGKFGAATVGRLLGHESRWVTERWLADRSVFSNYSMEDLEADRQTLEKLLPRAN